MYQVMCQGGAWRRSREATRHRPQHGPSQYNPMQSTFLMDNRHPRYQPGKGEGMCNGPCQVFTRVGGQGGGQQGRHQAQAQAWNEPCDFPKTSHQRVQVDVLGVDLSMPSPDPYQGWRAGRWAAGKPPGAGPGTEQDSDSRFSSHT